MGFFNRNIKRERIVHLAKGTIVPGALNEKALGVFIKKFSSELPIFFFDTVGDGNVAGLVLATMLEDEILDIHQVNDSGYTFIKFTAEMDSDLFAKKAPRVLKHLRSMELLNSHPGPGTATRGIDS